MAVPSLNPVSAPTVICPNCKNLIQPEVEPTKKRGMPDIRYVCANEASNCTWVMVLSQQHIMGDMSQLKPEEVESRRAQAAAAQDMKDKHEAQVRKLIMLLPHIELLLEAVKDPDPETALPENPPVSELPPPQEDGVSTEVPA